MKRPYLVLSILILLFAAPGIIAYLVYTHPNWVPTHTNHGRLLQPVPRLQTLKQPSKWQLLYWSPTPCDAFCARRMNDLARIRLALGRRLYHVDTVLAMPVRAPELSPALQQQLHHDDATMHRLNAMDEKVLGVTPSIYIINPTHDVILAYTVTQANDDIFQDLKTMVRDR